jgi:predicted TPR repeat methyltransferase
VTDPFYYLTARNDMIRLIPAGTSKILEIGCGAGMTGNQLKEPDYDHNQKALRCEMAEMAEPAPGKFAHRSSGSAVCLFSQKKEELTSC